VDDGQVRPVDVGLPQAEEEGVSMKEEGLYFFRACASTTPKAAMLTMSATSTPR
jgi:hypothetical protein